MNRVDRVSAGRRCVGIPVGGTEMPVRQGQTQLGLILEVGNKGQLTLRRECPQTSQQGDAMKTPRAEGYAAPTRREAARILCCGRATTAQYPAPCVQVSLPSAEYPGDSKENKESPEPALQGNSS